MLDYSKTLTNILSDPSRIELIVDYCEELLANGNFIYVFSDRISHLELIKSHLKVPSEILDNVNVLTGGTKSDAMNKAEKSANIILTTYQYLGTGKSIPKMNACILASPRKTGTKQFIGRIFRMGNETDTERRIIDIVDWNTTAKQQWYIRKKIYQSEIIDKGIAKNIIKVEAEYQDFLIKNES